MKPKSKADPQGSFLLPDLAARLDARHELCRLARQIDYPPPKHGSRLNLVETLFGKMARTSLRSTHVKSWQELKDLILLGIQEINQAPIVHRWRNFSALETTT
jgi:transposase